MSRPKATRADTPQKQNGGAKRIASFPRALASPISARDLIARVDEAPLAIFGDIDVLVSAVAAYDDAASGCLVFQKSKRANIAEDIARCPAALVVTAVPAKRAQGCAVQAADPARWFVKAISSLFPRVHEPGMDESARISSRATLGQDVRVEAFAVIEEEVEIGARTLISSGAVIARGSRIGAECVIGSNTVIGQDGLAAVSEIDQSLRVFPHLGGVLIGDAVEIGAHCCVVRGILKDTIVGSRVKMANHVNVGHNCRIGDDCWISGHVIVCGSAVLEAGVMVGAGGVINNRITVGKGARIGLGSVVIKSVPAGATVLGSPAVEVPILRPF